jgi:hypothetical protein
MQTPRTCVGLPLQSRAQRSPTRHEGRRQGEGFLADARTAIEVTAEALRSRQPRT